MGGKKHFFSAGAHTFGYPECLPNNKLNNNKKKANPVRFFWATYIRKHMLQQAVQIQLPFLCRSLEFYQQPPTPLVQFVD